MLVFVYLALLGLSIYVFHSFQWGPTGLADWLILLGVGGLALSGLWALPKETGGLGKGIESGLGIAGYAIYRMVKSIRLPYKRTYEPETITEVVEAQPVPRTATEAVSMYPSMEHNGLRLAFTLGLDNNNKRVLVNLGGETAGDGAHMLVCAGSGSGKTVGVFWSMLVQFCLKPQLASDCELWICDGKGGGDRSLMPFRPVARRFAGPDAEEIVNLLADLRAEVERRRKLNVKQLGDAPWIVLAYDEPHEAINPALVGRQTAEKARGYLETLATTSRDVKIRMVLATQHWTSADYSTRTMGQLRHRVLLAVTSPTTASQVFGFVPTRLPSSKGNFLYRGAWTDGLVAGTTYDTQPWEVEAATQSMAVLLDNDIDTPLAERVLKAIATRRRGRGITTLWHEFQADGLTLTKGDVEAVFAQLRDKGLIRKTANDHELTMPYDEALRKLSMPDSGGPETV